MTFSEIERVLTHCPHLMNFWLFLRVGEFLLFVLLTSRFFSREKRTCGAALIVSKLEGTALSSIALSVLVANLFGIPFGPFFIIFLRDDQNIGKKHHILRFFDNDDSFS